MNHFWRCNLKLTKLLPRFKSAYRNTIFNFNNIQIISITSNILSMSIIHVGRLSIVSSTHIATLVLQTLYTFMEVECTMRVYGSLCLTSALFCLSAQFLPQLWLVRLQPSLRLHQKWLSQYLSQLYLLFTG